VFEEDETPTVIELVADIIAAYVSNNNVPPTELGALITGVHAALAGVEAPKAEEPQAKRTPAVPIKKSITAEGITCLFDGQTFKTLRRHLLAAHGMTPVEYRQAWGLDPDYPPRASALAPAPANAPPPPRSPGPRPDLPREQSFAPAAPPRRCPSTSAPQLILIGLKSS
jgi:predicted transcriptional regulator